MGTIITSGAATIAPTIALRLDTTRAAGNIVHDTMGEYPIVTLRAGGSRQGTIELGFQGVNAERDSRAAEQLLGEGRAFTIVTDERATLAFSFVVTGTVERLLEDESRDAWLVTFGFREVSA